MHLHPLFTPQLLTAPSLPLSSSSQSIYFACRLILLLLFQTLFLHQKSFEIAMVRGFAMDSQDKRMSKSESCFGGGGVGVDYNHWVYEEDYFGDMLNIFDFPMESLDIDGLAEDWASKLGPIPSEIFRELSPPVVVGGDGGGGGGGSTDSPLKYPVLKSTASPPQQPPSFHKETRPSFEAPSPKSVLESRTSNPTTVPVRTRTKRLRPTVNPWLQSPLIRKEKKKRSQPDSETIWGAKKCTHCEITKTPQWREGPMGPRTLCNACGVRFRSGRLYPEYRPAASPTFVPSLHSNSHRKVIEMRQKGVKHH